MTYFRIQPTSRDTAELLDENTWVSLNWGGASMECRGCVDCADPEYRFETTGQNCRGTHEVDTARAGVSVCPDLETLAAYAARAGMDLCSVPMSIVEINGPSSADTAEDAELGEELIFPTQVISVRDVDDEFIETVYAELETADLY